MKQMSNKLVITLKKINKESAFYGVLALVLFFLISYRFTEAKMPILLDDEYGYWSNSAFFLGNNWSSITQNIAYYSYGYSLLLVFVKLLAGFLGLGWAQTYQMAVVLNVLCIVGSYFLALQISKRYLHHMNWFVKGLVCFAVMLYPTNMIYSHTTLTECTLTFVFWIIAYTMMRMIDKPTILNHVSMAFLAIYIYVVHQRSLAVLITAVMVVLYIRLVRISQMKHAASFGVTLYICYIIHTIIKGNLQNIAYLGNQWSGIGQAVSYAFTKTSALMLMALLVILLLLFLIDKGKIRLTLSVVLVGIAVIVVYFASKGISAFGALGQDADYRMSVNDFAGQWGKVIGIFSVNGMVRLGTSVAGKWFYLAAGSGLVICWGLRDLIINFFWMLIDTVRRAVYAVRHKQCPEMKRLEEDWKTHIWMTGIFLAFTGTFLICAIYKEGLYKVDDLIHGRYIEFLIGVVLMISVNSLLADKHWIATLIISLILFVAAGHFCQYVYDELQRTEYELAHAVMFGRIFWNYESPTGKIRIVEQYVLPMGIGFILLLKAFRQHDTKKQLLTIRCVLALLIPAIAWSHLSRAIIDNYVVVRNEKQSGAMPDTSTWAKMIAGDKNIYFIGDSFSYKQASVIQFMLYEKTMVMTDLVNVNLDEDAVYILHDKYMSDSEISEKLAAVKQFGNYVVAINKNQDLMRKWEVLKNSGR